MIQNYRLIDTTLYITLKPYIIYTKTIIHNHINHIIFNTHDTKTNTTKSLINILHHPNINHRIKITKKILTNKYTTLLNNFFHIHRQKIKTQKKTQSSTN